MFSDIDNFLRAKSHGESVSHYEYLACLMVVAHARNQDDALKLMKAIHELQISRKELNLTVPTTVNASVLQNTTINYNVILLNENSG